MVNKIKWLMAFSTMAASASAKSYAWIELESVTPATGWEIRSNDKGFFGTGYLYWTGNDILPAPPASSVMEYEFTVDDAANYQFEIHARRNHSGTCAGAADDHCNDVFTKVNNSQWIKTMAKAPWDTWGWTDGVSPGGTTINKWRHELKAGKNTLYLGARSRGIAVDAVRVFKVGAIPPSKPDVVTSILTPKGSTLNSTRDVSLIPNVGLKFNNNVEGAKVYNFQGRLIGLE